MQKAAGPFSCFPNAVSLWSQARCGPQVPDLACTCLGGGDDKISSMPMLWVKGVPLVTPLQTPARVFLGFQASLSAPRSMWKLELALLLTRDENTQAIPPPLAPGTHRCLEQVMSTPKLRGLSLEGGCDRIAFLQSLPGVPLESKHTHHPPHPQWANVLLIQSWGL